MLGQFNWFCVSAMLVTVRTVGYGEALHSGGQGEAEGQHLPTIHGTYIVRDCLNILTIQYTNFVCVVCELS